MSAISGVHAARAVIKNKDQKDEILDCSKTAAVVDILNDSVYRTLTEELEMTKFVNRKGNGNCISELSGIILADYLEE